MSLPIEITVGSGGMSPAPGTTEYINPFLKGKEFYVTSSGYGPLPYSAWEPLTEGGFRLLNAEFSEEETYFVVITSVSDVVGETAYTNGFNYQRVINAMLPRLGFRQPSIAGFNIVNAGNRTSTSGRYFDDFHALVNIKNIKETNPDAKISDADFNAYLESLKKSVIMRCLNGVLNVPEQLERVLLYDRQDSQPEVKIDNKGLFVGYAIDVARADDIAVQLESVSLLFDQDTEFKLYLFKDGKKTPVWIQEVSALAEEPTVVNLNTLVLNYIGQFTRGSRFYFGYFQDDLGTAKAIREQSCSWGKQLCFSAKSFSSPANGNNFDRAQIATTYDAFGLNLEVSAFRDHTNAIVKQAHLFDELVGLQMAYTIIEQAIYAVRSNATERTLKGELDKAGIQMDLNGVAAVPGTPTSTGLKHRIDREMKRVRDGFYPRFRAQNINLAGC